MRSSCIVVLLTVLICSLSDARSIQRYSRIGDLPLESGDTLYECSVGFRTFGTLNKERSNAILYCTWYMGTSADIERSVGGDGYPDTLQFFVIVADALSNGVSSSPSNSTRQPGERFPTISMHDMVVSQYRMVKKEFGIAQLHGIVGGSMGGMQVFEWLVSFPEFMKKGAATVGSPRLTSYNRLLYSTLLKIIEDGNKYAVSEQDRSALYSMTFALVLRTPELVNKDVPREQFEQYLGKFRQNPHSAERLTDLSYQLRAMLGHNIYRHDTDDIALTVARIKAKILLIVATNDLAVHPDPAVQFASAAKAEIIQLTNDCGHLAPGCEQKRTSEAINSFFGD